MLITLITWQATSKQTGFEDTKDGFGSLFWKQSNWDI